MTAASIATFVEANLSEARFADYLVDTARDVFVAESATEPDAGTLVGYTMLVAGEPADADVVAAISMRPTVELSKCYVDPDAHGAGVAADLVAVSLDAARKRGAAAVWLGVNQQNARANRFYEKQGFARVGTKRFLVGDRFEDDFVRERIL